MFASIIFESDAANHRLRMEEAASQDYINRVRESLSVNINGEALSPGGGDNRGREWAVG